LASEISGTCEIYSGYYYCIQVDFSSTSTAAASTTSTAAGSSTTVAVSTTTAVASTTTASTTGDGISTPSPIQTGMVSTCDEFYLVASGDTCDSIVADYGISLATFYAWNPAVGTDCADLELSEYVCVDIIGYTITSATATATATSTGDGISTPSPIQTGMISTCDEFYLVASGDTCDSIVADYGISLATFYAWNPAVGTDCADLELSEYVCVDIIGYTITSVTATATTTTTGDGVSTPSPIQTGIVSTCDKFYLVVSGDTCDSVASDAGISLTTFYDWNPAVGTDCADLEVDEYVCVDIIGYVASSTTTAAASTTTSGNGITTPTPYETGMVSDCNAFYLVSSGDSCTTIADAEDITVADIEAWNADVGTDCADIWLGYYICVGIL
jgi:LysM repeat protein